MLRSKLASLTKRITMQQLKLLNHVYGAACDNQYLLTTMPQYAKRITISRQMSDETNWHKLDAELLRSLVGGSTWLCNGAILIPMDRLRRKPGPRLKRCTGCGELMSRQNGATKSNSFFAKSEPESDEQSLLDWRDPFTTKVQLANPTDEEDPDFKGHNITMV